MRLFARQYRAWRSANEIWRAIRRHACTSFDEVARTRPERVEGVVIRDVTGEGRDAARYASAFEGVAPGRWHIFRDGEAWLLN